MVEHSGEVVVTKFGGTSNSSADSVQRCMELGRDSQILVTSAPGILSPEQLAEFDIPSEIPSEILAAKVTDQLLRAYKHQVDNGEIASYVLDSITMRYTAIVKGLGISALNGDWLKSIAPRIENATQNGEDYASMLGERLQAEVYQALDWQLLDPGRSKAALLPRDVDAWRIWLEDAMEPGQRYVLPGNTYSDGNRLRTFARGGSDISSALAAVAIHADVNRNMSDTPAQSIGPSILKDPKRRRTIAHLTYEEGRELGRNGTGLIHPEAIVPLMGSGIPTEVRNTFDPSGECTIYSDEADDERRTGKVVAISLIPEASVIYIHKPGMSEDKGSVADMSARVAEAGVNVIDVVGYGSDGELFIVNEEDQVTSENALAELIGRHGRITTNNCALITLVGYKLRKKASDIRSVLTHNGGLGPKYHLEDQYWFEGQNSLRFTVAKEDAADVAILAHERFVETP